MDGFENEVVICEAAYNEGFGCWCHCTWIEKDGFPTDSSHRNVEPADQILFAVAGSVEEETLDCFCFDEPGFLFYLRKKKNV